MLSSRHMKSGSYAENLYKRSSFYRDWSSSLEVVDEKQSRSTVSESIKENETFLAKAVYDNLADAPDELSFRKGDIVTVVEQDVDGLVGWWLCLLHGRQGIVPGNRLRILPSIESDSRNSSSHSLLSNDSLHSIDSIDGKSSDRILRDTSAEYDVLPSPIKAPHGGLATSPSPRTLQESFSSSKQSSPLHPSSLNNSIGPQSDYDVLPKRGPLASETKLNPEELYDIPTKPIQNDAIYDDLPNRRSIQSSLIVGSNSPQPKFQNVFSAFTAIPDGNDANAQSRSPLPPNSSLYDSPRVPESIPSDLYDSPPRINREATQDAVKQSSSNEDFYSTPPLGGTEFRKVFNFSMLRQEKSTLLNGKTTAKDSKINNNSEEMYDVPARLNGKFSGTTNNASDLYDTPPRQIENLIPSQGDDTYDTLPSIPKQFTSPSSDIYDKPVPSAHSTEIYDAPPKRENGGISNQGDDIYDTLPAIPKQLVPSPSDIYDTPVPHSHSTEIYDAPPKRAIDSSIDFGREMKGGGTEIYDVPPSHTQISSSPSDVYDVPRSQKSELYEVYDTPSSVSAGQNVAGDAIYDTPPHTNNDTTSSTGVYDQQYNQSSSSAGHDLYDTPIKSDVNKAMSDITRFKTVNQSLTKVYTKRHDSKSDGPVRSSNHCDDDYVDYQDIYGKEPPTEVVKEMEKVSEGAPAVAPKKPLRKKSSLDQINMSAVKELKLNRAQAFDRINKLHLAVDTSVSALLLYSSGDWLNPSNLSQNIMAIKDMAGKVKLALRLLTEFGLGVVVNGKLLNLDSLVARIKEEIDPLIESYYRIKVCLLHLDSCKWIVPKVMDNSNDKFFATVNAIMILAGQVPDLYPKLTSTLRSNVNTLFIGDEPAQEEAVSKGVKDRMVGTKVNSNLVKSTEVINSDKGKSLIGTVDDKKVREILELDARRPASVWTDQDTSLNDRANGADMSPMEMKQEFQSRRQKSYSSTLPRRPPVPPKPNLPSNRRSMAGFINNDDEVVPTQTVAKADTLVTDFIAEDTRKKYASDPSRSPVEPEATRRPEWGGSCPQLDDPVSYNKTPQGMQRATSSGTAASSTSTISLNVSADDLDANANMNKMASDTNLFAQTMIPARVTEPVAFTHVRSASLPWDENKIPFTSYEKQQNSSSKPAQANTRRLSKLDHRDSESIIFFLQRVESQVLILRDAVRNLTESVSNSESPQLFVPHAKFVILTAHKVVHAGEELCGKLLNDEVKSKVKRATGRLADSIRGVVAGTKQAALDYPDQNSLMEMMTTVLSVGESVREVHKEAKKALEL